MRFSRAISLLAFLLIGVISSAQVRNLDQMPNQKINDFYQDSEGYVWISTDYGICRYNGSDYVNYFHLSSEPSSIPSNGVICAREDSKGRLWVLTDSGVCRLNRVTDSFVTVLADKGLLGMTFLNGNMVCHGKSGFICINTEEYDCWILW